MRGSFTNEYPYPFLDVNVLGASAVALNCVMLCGMFLVLSLLFAGLDKFMGRANHTG